MKLTEIIIKSFNNKRYNTFISMVKFAIFVKKTTVLIAKPKLSILNLCFTFQAV
jgi:hypothetical protein